MCSIIMSRQSLKASSCQPYIGRIWGFLLEHGFVETGRQAIDEINVAGELLVLLFVNTPRDEDPQMADRFMHCVDNRLTGRKNVLINLRKWVCLSLIGKDQ